MSRSRAWFAKGPALETYENKIYAQLDELLAVVQPPEGALLFVRLYMIGQDEDSANPVVMVCCANRQIRKDAELLIRKSEILDRFPGFGLGCSAMLLESMGPEKLVTVKKEHQQRQVQSPWKATSTTDGIIKIYEEHPIGPGARIRIVQISNGGVSLVHEATAGPIFQLGTDFYQITVGHGTLLNTAEESPHYSLSELDECEFDGQWDISDEIVTDRGSMTPQDCSPASSDNNTNRTSNSDIEAAEDETKTQNSNFITSAAGSLPRELLEASRTFAGSSTSSQGSRSGMGSATAKHGPVSPPIHVKTEPGIDVMQQTVEDVKLVTGYAQIDLQLHNRDLDYVLLKLPTQYCLTDSTHHLKLEKDFQSTIKDISHVGSEDTRVIVASRDGAIPGYISPETISYKMRGFTRLQKLLPVRLEGILHEGYSGSAVVDASTGMLYGQIVLGSPGDTLAYCVRSPDIFADIVSKLSRVPVLEKRRWDPNCFLFEDLAAARGTIRDTTDMAPKLKYVAKSEDKAAITEAKEHRKRTMCTQCDENPDGFEEEHELKRHEEAKHDVHKTSASGKYNSGTDSFGALHSLEKGDSLLRTQGSKRKRDMDTPPPSRPGSNKRTPRTFACPFYLHDRIRHSSCLYIKLNRVADARQHVLGQVHHQVVHCPVCGITFTGRIAEARRRRDAHVQAETCEPSPHPCNYPGITEDEEQRIREIARNTRTTQYTEVQRWYMIWDFLFPGEQRPDSPFLTDVPAIQRVVDWTDAIFGSELWQELPNQPWTSDMRREDQRSGMLGFIHSFIAQARGLVGQKVVPVEDDHGLDNSSSTYVDTPGPSGSAPHSIQSLNLHAFSQMDPATGESSAGVEPNPSRPLHHPAENLPQDTQQRAELGGATNIDDPTIPLLVFDDPSVEDLFGFDLEWPNSMIGNDDAGSDDNHASAGGGELGGRQED